MGELSVAQLAGAWERAFGPFEPSLVAQVLGRDLQPRLLGRLLALQGEVPARAERLDAIPSETTPDERRFLHSFAARVWAGRESVLEIGPFLGGTTRALAMGMLLNPERRGDARLFTYDRFADYYDAEALRRLVEPLVRSGDLAEPPSGGHFLELFLSLHAGTEYAPLILAQPGVLPDSRTEEATLADPIRLPDGQRFDLVFVDGAKSWYGMKSLLRTLAPRVTGGAHLVFQDYGWYTCFWVSAALQLLGDHFELTAYVDATYAFQLVKRLEADTVERLIPDSPADLGAERLEQLFCNLGRGAAERSDIDAFLFHALHEASALRHLGQPERATNRLRELVPRTWSGRQRELLDMVLRDFNSA